MDDPSARAFRFNFAAPPDTAPPAPGPARIPAPASGSASANGDPPQEDFDKHKALNGNDEESQRLLPPPREVFSDEVESSKSFPTDPVVFQGGFSLLKGKVSTSRVIGLSKTDLIAGKYEGGFKLWECTMDLINILRREVKDGQLTFRGKRVLELGCGHGLPGIFAILKGARTVHFQDFNAEVLRSLTIPNVRANVDHIRSKESAQTGISSKPKQMTSDIHYYAGDWGDMSELLSTVNSECSGSDKGDVPPNTADGIGTLCGNVAAPTSLERNSTRALERAFHGGEGGYDIILMSETVYSLASISKLYDIIKKCLRPRYGVLYLAAKKHYFGVGGGTRQFKALVDEEGILGAHLVTDFADGSSNIRETWKLFFR